ncbi:hypothetical protein Aperf_G00000079793 [Anoplocephala perfoliata]
MARVPPKVCTNYRASPGDCVSVLQIMQTLIHGTKPKEDPACNPDETLCVKVIGKQNVFIRGTLPRVPYIVSAKLGLLIRRFTWKFLPSKAPPPIVIPPPIGESTEKAEIIDETTSGWTDKSTAETSGENDHTSDGSGTTMSTGELKKAVVPNLVVKWEDLTSQLVQELKKVTETKVVVLLETATREVKQLSTSAQLVRFLTPALKVYRNSLMKAALPHH